MTNRHKSIDVSARHSSIVVMTLSVVVTKLDKPAQIHIYMSARHMPNQHTIAILVIYVYARHPSIVAMTLDKPAQTYRCEQDTSMVVKTLN